jgi:transposase
LGEKEPLGEGGRPLVSGEGSMAASISSIFTSISARRFLFCFSSKGSVIALARFFGGGAVFDQRGAGQMQLLQLGDGLADAGARRQIKNLAHARERRGVGAIGFHELAGDLGETARLARINLGDGQASVVQRTFERAMIGARGLSRALYQKLVEAGKPAKVAITAVMRKLVVLANALLRDDRSWAENAPCA